MVNAHMKMGIDRERERFMLIKKKTLWEIKEKVESLIATGENFDKIAAGELIAVMQKIQNNFK